MQNGPSKWGRFKGIVVLVAVRYDCRLRAKSGSSHLFLSLMGFNDPFVSVKWLEVGTQKE
ncbi:hypothetical protein BSPA111_03220 [Buttiauxella sp. A111]|nr:hypothetical protein BSPA111_03220 [Buttiauxella sp. A111]